MEPEPGFTDEGLRDPVLGGAPFSGPGLLARVAPFALVAAAAEASLAAKASDQVLGMLRTALGLLGTPGGQTLISVEAAERLSVTVAGTGRSSPGANGDGSTRDFGPLRERARRDGVAIEIEPAAHGIRVGWSVPLCPVP